MLGKRSTMANIWRAAPITLEVHAIDMLSEQQAETSVAAVKLKYYRMSTNGSLPSHYGVILCIWLLCARLPASASH